MCTLFVRHYNIIKCRRNATFVPIERYKFFCLFVILLAACAPQSVDEPVRLTVTPMLVPTVAPALTQFASQPNKPISQNTVPPASQPANSPTPKPTNTPSPQAALPAKVSLNLTHEYQKWNNCGPVSLAIVTTFFGIERNQFQVATEVKGFEMDKNVGPTEMQAYLQSVGLHALVRVNGSGEIVQRLLAAGLPVIVHQWLLKSNGELVGHYRVLQGYDLTTGTFISSDPFTPPRKSYSFAEFEKFWQPWNHRYIVAYRAEQAATVRTILGDNFAEQKNFQAALLAASESIKHNASDAYEFFNRGDDRLGLGDAAGAVESYEKSFALGLPAHFYWYNFGPFEAYYRAGNFQRMLDWSAPMLKEAGNVEEIRFWRGKAWLALGQKQKAREEFSLAVQLNAHYADAKAMLAQVQ